LILKDNLNRKIRLKDRYGGKNEGQKQRLQEMALQILVFVSEFRGRVRIT